MKLGKAQAFKGLYDECSIRAAQNPVVYEVDDLVALSKLVGRSSRQMLRLAAGAVLILILFTISAEVWALTGLIDWASIIVVGLVSALVLLFSNRRFRATMWLKFAARGPLYGAHCYAISPDAFRISSPKSVSEVKWAAFIDVKLVGDRLFLFVSRRQALIVPGRAFDGNETFEKFAAAASEYWERGFRA